MANIKPKNQIEVDKFLKEVLPKQIGYAASLTLNEIAFRIRKDTIDSMKTVFHKPTPWTLRSIVVERTERRGGTSAWVGLKHSGIRNELSSQKQSKNVFYDDTETYVLSHQFRGGFRKQKAWENKLISKRLMPKGYFAVETNFCPKDQYDNPKLGFIKQMMSYFDMFPDVGSKQNMGAKGRAKFAAKMFKASGVYTQFFISKGPFARGAGPTGRWNIDLPMGIWRTEGQGKNEKSYPVFLFVPKHGYRKRVFMEQIAQRVIARDVYRVFSDKLTFALRTANY